MVITSNVRNAVLYRDRARVLRQGTASVEKGPFRIEIQNLPVGIDRESARVRLIGKAKLFSFDLRNVNFVESPSVDIREIERNIEEKSDTLGILTRSIEIQTQKSGRAAALSQESRTFARGLALGRLELTRQREIFIFLDEEQNQSSQEIAKLEAEKRTLEREIAKLEADLAARQSPVSRQRIDAVIEAEALETGAIEIEITYVSTNASWKPLYDFRFGEKLEIHYMALVSQSTGEEWNDVSIDLSTAALAQSESIPEFDPWYIRAYVPIPPPSPQSRTLKAAVPGMIEPAPAASGTYFQEEQMLGYAEAEIRSGSVVAYGVHGRTNLPGNGETKKLTIALSEFDFKTDYVAAPLKEEAVFRRGEFENTSKLVMLEGSAQVFFADDLTGKTEIEETIPGQTRKLFLGIESRIRVKRELTKHETDKKFLGDNRRLRWEYRIEIENQLDREAALLLREQIPVSTNEQIKIKYECSLKPDEKDMGTLEWQLAVPSRGKITMEYALIIEHPRTMQVTGLP